MGNSFGNIFIVTTYGESHGEAIGAVIDGCPSGVKIDLDFIQNEMDQRKPGVSVLSSPRAESDIVKIISGVYEGMSTGMPIHLMIENKDVKSGDYDTIKTLYRPSHADFTYEKKYGIRDPRGGGRSSARETACRVAAGAIAKSCLKHWKIKIYSFVSKVGKLTLTPPYQRYNLTDIYENEIRCPDEQTAKLFINHIKETKDKGDSLGGVISTIVKNTPIGLGAPIYDKINARLAQAMLSINAVHGFEFGSGFAGTDLFGSEHNDEFVISENTIKTKTNFSGGIQGGITNGMDIEFNVAFKPTATISKEQNTLDREGNPIKFSGIGRHDPCVLPRAVPIVEAMTALVLLDFILLNQTTKISDIHV